MREIDNICEEILKKFIDEKMQYPRRAWLDELPDRIEIGKNDEHYFGLIDVPQEQIQVKKHFYESNVLILGDPKSGKTGSLKSFFYDNVLHDNTISCYIMCKNSIEYNDLKKYTQIGCIADFHDDELMSRLIKYLEKECICATKSNILLLIDDFDSLRNDYRTCEKIVKILTSSKQSNNTKWLIGMTSVSESSIGLKIKPYFPNEITLKSDVNKKLYKRGEINDSEIQITNFSENQIVPKNNKTHIIKKIDKDISLEKIHRINAKKPLNIPVGIYYDDLKKCIIDFSKPVCLLGKKGSHKEEFLQIILSYFKVRKIKHKLIESDIDIDEQIKVITKFTKPDEKTVPIIKDVTSFSQNEGSICAVIKKRRANKESIIVDIDTRMISSSWNINAELKLFDQFLFFSPNANDGYNLTGLTLVNVLASENEIKGVVVVDGKMDVVQFCNKIS